MTKATGLGKRKAKEPSDDDDDVNEGVYFAVDDQQDELEQVSVMFAHAELALDQPEKCIPLLRAVVHECDRLGRTKEALDDGDLEGPLLQGLGEQQLAQLRRLELTEEFYRVYGDALYRLALVDEAKDDDSNPLNLLEAAKGFYETGLSIFHESLKLKFSLLRNDMMLAIFEGHQPKVRELFAIISSLAEDRQKYFAYTFELFDLLQQQDVDLVDFANLILETIASDEKDDALLLGKLKAINYLIESRFDHDDFEACQQQLTEAHSILCRISFDLLQDDIKQALLPIKAQMHIWSGCLAEANDLPVTDVQAEYNKAIETWREINQAFGHEIPKEILELA